MNDILNKSMVLLLNRNWQAVNVRMPQEAFCMMATNVATGLEIEGEHHIRPGTWDEWLTLPIRPQDNTMQTVLVSLTTIIQEASPDQGSFSNVATSSRNSSTP
ncbi:MAG: hypothetical protein ACLQVY_17630 [Limisphaerales bacterium]